ncbi:MAG: hypothetical protein IJU41_00260 [Clostridia bacterium]|nr:hypothetical protein [Clostridia bacterium]
MTGQATDAGADDLNKYRELYGKNRKKRSYVKLLIRELIWFFGRWRSKELDAFLKDFSPQVVVFSMEGYIHLNRLCRYIIKKTGARAIGYFWDDNFTYKQLKNNIGYTVLRFFQRRSLKRLSKCTDRFWAISPKTKREADAFFGIDSVLLTKPADLPQSAPVAAALPEPPLKIVYTGNLAIGRTATILSVSKALDRINEKSKRMELFVYTPTALQPEEADKIGNAVHVLSPVSIEEVAAVQQAADILLFVEDIDGPLCKKARLSFSTKITDYLKSGKCIVAIGNADTAPMEYFAQTGAAICVTETEAITSALRMIADEPALLAEYAARAYACAKENHDGAKIRQTVRDTISSLV